MLKTKRGQKVWLITQPAHAELAGQMAAHWGNEDFAAPGHFTKSPDPKRLRREVVLAVAEHDNGWWEWEADPPLSAEDGLPQGLGEVLEHPAAGLDRWRLGIPRLAERHPYASLIIGDHAYWLYATQFNPDPLAEFTHILQRGQAIYQSALEKEARRFLADVRHMQEEFRIRLEKDPLWEVSLEPEHRKPHARLLQTLDALSSALCSCVIKPVEGEGNRRGPHHIYRGAAPKLGGPRVARGQASGRRPDHYRPVSIRRITADSHGSGACGRSAYITVSGTLDSEAIHIFAEVV